MFKIKPLVAVVLLICYIEAKPNVTNFFSQPVFKDFYGKIDANIKVGDAGDPLILTDLIRQNKIQEAQSAAEVNPDLFLGIKSYAGYLKVDEVYNSNLFFWFFPSQSNPDSDPLILWLQGGPGSPSLYGLFQENGPFYFVAENKLALRNTSWTLTNSVLYIDQPAGTGFSFTTKGYARNQTKVGSDLYNALYQFFQLFPKQQSNDFFIAGESYAGKYIPAIGYTILKNNPSADLKINLKGLAIGNGLSDPKHQIIYSEYLYQHGFIDTRNRDLLESREELVLEAMDKGNWDFAIYVINSNFAMIHQKTGLNNIYNYVDQNENDKGDAYMGTFLAREDVRKALHVGNTPFNDDQVYDILASDIPKSVAPWVTELLGHYRIMIFNGQLDIMVPYRMTIDYLESLDLSYVEEYKNLERTVWYSGENNEVAGYIKTIRNLTDVLVRNAGHMVPADQPVWALELINKFVRNQL